MSAPVRYSVVIPVYNEEAIVPELYRRLRGVLDAVGDEYETIFVDDGSTDSTLRLLEELAGQDPRVVVLSLSRNFGNQPAVSAGLAEARGEAVVVMDGDLQDRPEALPLLFQHWRDGYAVVYVVKRNDRERPLRRLALTGFYKLLSAFSSVPLPRDAGNFSLMDRRVVDLLVAMPERSRYISGLRSWVGFRQIGIEVERDARFAGRPRMSIAKLLRHAFDAFFSFSYVPLRLSIWLGLCASGAAFAYSVLVLWARFFTDWPPLGWTSAMFATLFLGGVILIVLGIIGEYVGRIYDELKQRPYFVVAKRVTWRPSGSNGQSDGPSRALRVGSPAADDHRG